MTTKEVADRFHELSQQGNFSQIQDELFDNNAVSIEPEAAQGLQSVQGLDGIKQKGIKFQEMVEEVHGGYSNEPVVAGNHYQRVDVRRHYGADDLIVRPHKRHPASAGQGRLYEHQLVGAAVGRWGGVVPGRVHRVPGNANQ